MPLDNFNRSENPLSTNWTNLLNSNQANGSTCQGNASGSGAFNISVWGTDYTGTQFVALNITTKPASGLETSMGLMSKDTGSLATIDGYAFHWSVLAGADSWAIERVDNGVSTVLANSTQEYTAGDRIALYLYPNGHMIGYLNSTRLGATATPDLTYTGSGKLTMTLESNTQRVDDFDGGNLPRHLAMMGMGF